MEELRLAWRSWESAGSAAVAVASGGEEHMTAAARAAGIVDSCFQNFRPADRTADILGPGHSRTVDIGHTAGIVHIAGRSHICTSGAQIAAC